MAVTCKKSDVLEMRISSSGYTLVSLLCLRLSQIKSSETLETEGNTTLGARSASTRNHSINPGNDTGGIAPAVTI